MIVKNEARIIERCLRSARPHIDRWCIVDTGSTDNTQALIRHELDGLRGMLFERPWVNYGANRTQALQLAQSLMNEYERAEHWALLIDADHELVSHGFRPDQLTEDLYAIVQRDDQLEYANTRLLQMRREWECIGVTHEYWPQFDDTPICKTLSILDHNDSGNHSSKYERDKQLLREDLKQHPNSERSVFYLAQTLEGMGDEACADLYRLRATMGGYHEEAWLARYRAGRITLARELHRIKSGREIGRELLKVEDCRGVAELLRAAADRPSRAEPLYQLAHFYREVDLPGLGYLFAQRAKAIPKPEKALFVEHFVYDFGIDQELAICAYYGRDLLAGAAACERLEHIGDFNGVANSFWYATTLSGERGVFSVPEALRTFEGVVYHCSNPSLCDDIVNVRLVGYVQQDGKSYISLCPDLKIRTRNAIAIAVPRGSNASPSYKCHVIEETLPPEWDRDAAILGLEDLRLARYQGRVWFTATCCQVPSAAGYPRVALGRLSQDLNRVDHVVAIQYGQQVEKNWLLWPDGDRLKCIYSFSPLVVLTLDPMTGSVLSVSEPTSWTAPGRFRGSAGPIQLESGHWLAVVHDVAHLESGNIYTHRFVAWKGDLFYATSPLLLEHRGIEYCAGMAVNGNTVTLSYGFEDREAHWLKLPLGHVLELLGITGGQGLPIESSLASHSA